MIVSEHTLRVDADAAKLRAEWLLVNEIRQAFRDRHISHRAERRAYIRRLVSDFRLIF